MSTLADELLNDFEDLGSEAEDEEQNGILQDGETPPTTNGSVPEDSMILDGDEEDVDKADETATEEDAAAANGVDEEETKAKVEKMQLGGVSDVRNVAGLMKTLEPVLKVSRSLPTIHLHA